MKPSPSTTLSGFLFLFYCASFVFIHQARANETAKRQGIEALALSVTALTVQADSLTLIPPIETGGFLATGDVSLQVGEWESRCEKAVWQAETKELKLYGDVHLKQDGREIRAYRLVLHLEKMRLLLLYSKIKVTKKDAAGRKSVFLMESARMERMDNGAWRLYHAHFTPCDCPKGQAPDWSVSAECATIAPEKSVELKKAHFRIKNRAVFPVEKVRIPLAERVTGFLFPQAGYSERLGFELATPFYWAIDEETDFTITPKGMSEKGVMIDHEFRLFDERTRFITKGFYLRDLQGERADVMKHRFGLLVKTERLLTDWLRIKNRFERYSDAYVPRDFSTGWRKQKRDFAHSQLWLNVEQASFFLSAYLKSTQTFFNPTYEDGSLWRTNADKQTHTMPGFRFSLPAWPLFQKYLFASLAIEGAYFVRMHKEEGQGDSSLFGLFFTPELALPISFGRYGAFHAYAKLSHHSYFPDEREKPTAHKGFGDVGLSMETTLYRIFRPQSLSPIKHELRPKLLYRYRTPSYERGALQTGTLGDIERREENRRPHYAAFQLTQALATRIKKTGFIRRFLVLTVEQPIFTEQKREKKEEKAFLPETAFHLDLEFSKLLWENEMHLDWQKKQLTDTTSFLTLGGFNGFSMQARYLFLRKGAATGGWYLQKWHEKDNEVHHLFLRPSMNFKRWVSLAYFADVSLKARKLIEHGTVVSVRSSCNCWRLSLEIRHQPTQYAPDVYFSFDLSGLVN